MEPQFTPSVQASEPATRSYRTLIIAVVIGILILAGGAFAYIKLASKPAAIPSPTASATSDVTAGWQNFSSQYFTLSFKVPPGFDVTDTQNEIAIAIDKYEPNEMGGSNAFFVLSRYQDGQTKTTATAAAKAELTNPITSQVTIDGSTFTKIEGRDDAVVEGVAPGKVVYLIFDQSVARFYEHGLWTGNADTITIGNQILASFRFTSPNIRAGWKTYTNTQYGFSFQYPSNTPFEQPETDSSGTYIRIQNYDIKTVEEVGFLRGNYYLEVRIHHNPAPCDHSNKIAVNLGNNVIGYQDREWWDVGEIGGPSLGLCVEKPISLLMHVTEKDQNVPLATQILSTFQFIK